jgi:peptide deformylase
MIAPAKVLALRYWNDPVLSMICDKIGDTEFGPQLEEFGRELIATMRDKNGVGLAAPQVGITKRMFAMEFPDHKEMEPIVLCNPTIKLMGGNVAGREGCLSLPNVYEQVIRADAAMVEYQDPTGKYFEIVISAFDARVAQHEYDHLDGIMFFDCKDKRENMAEADGGAPRIPRGPRMSRQMSRSVLREWDKIKDKVKR